MQGIFFNKENIQLLNMYLFDASVEFETINNLVVSSQRTIEFRLERRCFENVKREKILFFTKTVVQGMSSNIVINNVDKLLIKKTDLTISQNNHFLLSVKYDKNTKTLSFNSVTQENLIELIVDENFSIRLIDLSLSKYGHGVYLKKIGFTMEETINLKERVG